MPRNIISLVAIMATTTTGIVVVDASSSFPHRHYRSSSAARWCQRQRRRPPPPRERWKDLESKSALTMRGGDDGGSWGNSRPWEKEEEEVREEEQHRPGEESDAERTDDEQYEYEYYEADDEGPVGAEESVEYEYYVEGDEGEEDGGEEYEYYEVDESEEAEEEDEARPMKRGWNVQDIGGEFIEYSDGEKISPEENIMADNDEDVDDEDEGAVVVELRENNNTPRGIVGRPFWRRRNEAFVAEEAEADDGDGASSKEDDERDYEEEEEVDADDDEDYLFTTPIPATNESNKSVRHNLQLVNRTVPKNMDDIASEEENTGLVDTTVVESECEENIGRIEEEEAGKYYDNEDVDDYPSEAPLPLNENTENSVVVRRAHESSETDRSHRWHRPQIVRGKSRSSTGSGGRFQSWRPSSSSKASFISPLFYSGAGGASPRSLSVRSSSGRPIYTEWMSSISAAIGAIVQPIGIFVRRVSYGVAYAMSSWASSSWAFVRSSFDFLLYGPVDGVTTTGIASREGGLSALLTSSPVVIALSSLAFLGLARVLIVRLWREHGNDLRGYFRRQEGGRLPSSGHVDEEDDYEEDPAVDAVDPPSVEEELRFLNRDFDAANPSSKDRVAKAIIAKKRNSGVSWPSWRSRGGHGHGRSQRQFTIKSIQTWWKERPSQRAIAIIEPGHLLRNQQQPLGYEIGRLRKRLAASEQERANLEEDVRRLRHRLRSTQQVEAPRDIRLEGQTSRTDRMLARAVEVKRRKAEEEMLERERRMSMSGGRGGLSAGAGFGRRRDTIEGGRGRNDLDLNEGPSTRVWDGVKIVRDNENGADGETKWKAM